MTREHNPDNLRITERWIAAGIMLVSFVAQLVWLGNDSMSPALLAPFFRSISIYLLFIVLNERILPQLFKGRRPWLQAFYVLGLFFLTAAVIEITEMLFPPELQSLKGRSYFTSSFFYTWLIFLVICFYIGVKTAIIYLFFDRAGAKRYKLMVKDALIGAAAWLLGIFLLIAAEAEAEFLLGWVTFAPFTVLIYAWCFFRIAPVAAREKKPGLAYFLRYVLALLLTIFPMGFLSFLVTGNPEHGAAMAAANHFLHLLVFGPASWFLVKRHLKGNEELYQLRQELNQSNASLDLLRSQINPHFLFNALNTIYGLAIQEKAERTTAGIEMLADMMRFMLQENLEEKIPLNRELDYLRHYIELQKLRIDAQPSIRVETEIAGESPAVDIAPMLLIPFVENAFKHGISFREESLIRISLRFEANHLYFDVYNSRHARTEGDPEKNSNGIGLNNVRQRLEAIYPGKHELVIREIPDWFFVHLSLQLQ